MPRPQLKRADAKAKAEAAGATVGGDVTGKTTLVVNGGDGGAKLEKAKAKGIEIWDEASFMAAIGGGSSSSTAAAATTSGGGKKKKAEAPAEEPAAKKPKGKGKGKEAAPPPPPAAPPASKPSGGGGGRVRKPDRSVPDGGMYAVHEDYDVKLNQTNIGGGQNNNKFYIIQVLESGGQYFAWNRWGRVGEEGQHKMEACGTAAAAIKSFEKKFKDKTKNTWTSGASRDQFVKHDGKYQLVDVEDDDGGDGAALGKLSAEQIGKGQEVLEQIKAALNGEGGNVAFLSGQFYSLIPTQTGRTAPPAIADFGMLAEKEHQLDFWLRMGFEDMTQTLMDNPLEKMRDEPPPPTLQVAAGGVCDKMAIGQSQQRGQALEKAQAVRCAKGGSNAGLAAPAPLPSPSPARPGPFGALASVAGQAEQEDERRAVRGHRALHGQLHLPRAQPRAAREAPAGAPPPGRRRGASRPPPPRAPHHWPPPQPCPPCFAAPAGAALPAVPAPALLGDGPHAQGGQRAVARHRRRPVRHVRGGQGDHVVVGFLVHQRRERGARLHEAARWQGEPGAPGPLHLDSSPRI